ncbi:uncharacterized protein LOC113796135 [Dermatophagoides pteronyssinus]|uniref:DNA-directed RNA polymerase III subunit RPC3 n=2 Tax=Dermatophagoides pteronyssinus TaxID=6956 RepID=A0A6P6Y9P6_DERPT|nr:uncharacterized protein LOC113796135 [Dermatophagoides pteronyssinus]KAH9412544.1 hypothetical protein DERP_006506 [Dermatophagoides pteronyssinus]
MIHNHEKILVKLIEEYHSILPAKVAKILLYFGSITLKRARSYSTLKRNDFEKGLEILIRCDYVNINIIGDKKQRIFEIDTEKILNILFYPCYLKSIDKRFGVECVSLLKTLFIWGQLSINDLIERTLYHIIQTNSLDFIDDQIQQFIAVLYEKLMIMMSKNIIIFCGKNNDDDLDGYDADQIFKALKQNTDPDSNSGFTKFISKTSRLKFNIDALNSLYFMELFPYLLGDKFENSDADSIFQMLLDLNFEQSVQMKYMNIDMQQIFERYRTNMDNIDCSLHQMQLKLSFISHYFAPQFLIVGKTNCSLDFETFLTSLVKFIVKEYLRKNFGENSVKIFGALQEQICLFENNLLTMLKLDSKELHRNLYLMNQNRMININFYSETNLSSTSSARNVKKAFSVNLTDVVDCIVKRIQYSIYTIHHRRLIEMNEQKDLISRKNHIENYKKIIDEQVEDQEEKNRLITTAHNFMSDNDHKRAESLLSYDIKVDKIEYHLVNNLFILKLWQNLCQNQEKN